MNYGKKYILDAAADWGASGTRLIDVNVTDLISIIFIRLRLTVVTVSAMTDTVASTVSKIELVDGSNVIFSTSGERAQAAYFSMTGRMPDNQLSLTVDDYLRCTIPVMFGRYPGDADYALNPSMYSNLQLKITFNEDQANASLVVNQCEVSCLTLPRSYSGSVKGFLMTKDIVTYAMAASAHEYITLPSDYPIFALLMQGRSDDHAPSALIDKFIIDKNNNSEILYDEVLLSFYRDWYRGQFDRITQNHIADAAVTANTFYVDVAENVQGIMTYDDTAITANGELAEMIFTGHYCSIAACVVILKETFQISGDLPHACMPIPFMDSQMRPYWSVSQSDRLRMDILAQAAADSGDEVVVTAIQVKR